MKKPLKDELNKAVRNGDTVAEELLIQTNQNNRAGGGRAAIDWLLDVQDECDDDDEFRPY